jgi:hypothetical protein
MPDRNMMEAFLDAQRKTHILRTRKNLLYTFGKTNLPYVFLADSAVNEGDIVVRRGEVTVNPPKIIAPGNSDVELEGFGFEALDEGMVPVILNRWVQFPAAKYSNAHGSLDVVGGPIEKATEEVINRLDQSNDIRTGVIHGPEGAWGFSLLGYVGQMIVRSTPSNVGEFFERFGLSD